MRGTPEVGYRRYQINDGFFDTLTPESSYILGYIYGDGCVVKNGNKWNRVLVFGALKDESLIKTIHRVMGSSYPMLKRSDVCGFGFSSDRIVERLGELGLHPRATKRMTVPDLDTENFKNFVRGYLDADGWIGLNKGRVTVAFVSKDREFLTQLGQALRERLGLPLRLYCRPAKGRSGSTGLLQYCGSRALSLIQRCKPGPGEMSLGRKWARFN